MATFIPIIGELVGEATSLLAPVAEEAKAGLTAQGVFDVANAYGKAYPDSVHEATYFSRHSVQLSVSLVP